MLTLDRLKDESLFSPAELGIARYVLAHAKQVIEMTVDELAIATYTSHSAIVRMCKKVGFNGYTDFKIRLATEITTFLINDERIEMDMPVSIDTKTDEIKAIFLNLHYQALIEVYNTLDMTTIQKAADMIYKADFVSFYGAGPSLIVAEDLRYKLARIGILCVDNSLQGFDEVREKKKKRKEVAILVSHYGNSLKVKNWMSYLHAIGVEVIMICANRHSPVIKQADLPILIDNTEVRAFKMGSFASRTAMTYVADCIYALIFMKDYKENIGRLYDVGKRISLGGEYIKKEV